MVDHPPLFTPSPDDEPHARTRRAIARAEALSLLAGGIAHDFNNALATILGHHELLALEAGLSADARDSLEAISQATLRARDLVRELLLFSRPEVPTAPEVVDLRDIVRSALRFLRASLPSFIELNVQMEAAPLPVLGVPGQLAQLVLQLGARAGSAMQSQAAGALYVRVWRESVTVARAVQGGWVPPGEYAVLEMTDTGGGLSLAQQEALAGDATEEDAEPAAGVVRAIVQDHQGAFSIGSQAGVGTSVLVYLPVAVPASSTIAPALAASPARPCIVVCDDEPALCHLIARALERFGYEAHGFEQPTACLDWLRANRDRAHLLLTDHAMPDLPGEQLLERLRADGIGTPAILLTGFSQSLGPARMAALGVMAVLEKPVPFAELREVIAAALASRAADPS